MKSVTNGATMRREGFQKPEAPMPEAAVRTLANSIFEQLRLEGCNTKDIISVSSHLISLVTTEIQKSSPAQ